jgi:uncharacterized lipoprotein YddW (UPF0748 family)
MRSAQYVMLSDRINQKLLLALAILTITVLAGEDAWAANPEARAVWVTRWEYTTETGGVLPTTHKARIRRIMDRAVEGNFNVIVLQVRGQGDAYYASEYEPWAWELTSYGPQGLGTDPGWDPLQYAIEQAHQRGLELHAWLNTFNAWKGTTPPPTGIEPEHMYNLHPEWVCADWNGTPMPLSSDYVTFSPGNPDVIQHVHNVAMDVVERYDVDGIHFDYIRYPRDVYSRDFATDSTFFDQYGFYPDQNTELWKNWQRDRITLFVQNFYHAAIAIKPMVKISAAVIGRYNYPSSGWDCYNIVYQDARKWASWGIMDYLAPMIYWDMYEFAPLINEWTHYSYGRHIYAGIAAYRMDEFGGWSAIEDQIDTARAVDSEGLLFFRSGSLDRSNGYYWNQLGDNRFSTLATVPPMWWKDPVPPEAPLNFQITSEGGQNHLSWEAPSPASDGDEAAYYGVYRTTGGSVNVDDPEQLIYLSVGPATEFTDASVDSGIIFRYAVVAYDDGDNESAPSEEATTSVPLSDDGPVPLTCALSQNYPNPFNASTTIAFQLTEGVGPASLKIYNILGQEVTTLVDGMLPGGRHRVTWDGNTGAGIPVASGIYLCSLQAGNMRQTKRMILIR